MFQQDGVSWIFGSSIFNYLGQGISNRDMQKKKTWFIKRLETTVGSVACSISYDCHWYYSSMQE